MKLNLIIDNSNRIYANKYTSSKLIEEGIGIVDNDLLLIEPFEALYLLYKGRAILYKNDFSLDFNEALQYLTKIDSRCWEKFLVYNFLREKGFYVKKGYGDNYDFLLSLKKSKSEDTIFNYIITIIHEGKSLDIEKFDEMLNFASRMRKTLVLAIIDSNSDITAYEASKVNI